MLLLLLWLSSSNSNLGFEINHIEISITGMYLQRMSKGLDLVEASQEKLNQAHTIKENTVRVFFLL